MTREELQELNYITMISNVPSIMSLGILSHKQAQKVPHISVAMEEIQVRRKDKVVPGGLPLHDYVNLYICARNPMLFKLKDRHAELCVLRVSTKVLDMEGVIVTDMNAASGYARFAPALHGLDIVDKELTFAQYWTHTDKIEEYHRKAAKCAEVLVPYCVSPSFIIGAYVSGVEGEAAFGTLGVNVLVTIDPDLFFN